MGTAIIQLEVTDSDDTLRLTELTIRAGALKTKAVRLEIMANASIKQGYGVDLLTADIGKISSALNAIADEIHEIAKRKKHDEQTNFLNNITNLGRKSDG